jgi:single-strand DNA-binding protein
MSKTVGFGKAVKERAEKGKAKHINFPTAGREAIIQGVKVSETEWRHVVVGGKQVAIAGARIKKGSQIALEGKLVTRIFVDQNGQKRYFTEIMVKESPSEAKAE